MARKDSSSEKKQTKYSEQLDIPRVTINELKEQIELSLTFNQRRGCIVAVGEAGLGKTQGIGQVCRKMGYRPVFIHTAHYGMMGAGVPQRAEGDFFRIAVPDNLPKPGEKAVIIFDELNRGNKHSIQMFFTMLEDGRLFNYEIPEDCLVVGAMNPSTQNYTVTDVENEAAMRRRIKFMYVIEDFKGWKEHAASPAFHHGAIGPAKDKPCHPLILKFFSDQSKLLYDEKAKSAGKQYACPATVETVSEDAYNIEAQGRHSIYSAFAYARYSASIGTTMTTQLIEFLKDNNVMVGAGDVLARFKKVKSKINQLVSKQMHEPLSDLCGNVLNLMFADQPAIKTTAKNFLQFCSIVPPEMAANMLFQMKEVAGKSKAETYLHDLMLELQEQRGWIDLQVRIDESHRQVDDGLRAD